MSTSDPTDRCRWLLALSVLVMAGTVATARAQEFDKDLHAATSATPPQGDAAPSVQGWLERPAKLWQELWATGLRHVRDAEPAWLKHRAGEDPTGDNVAAGQGAFCLVLQEDRADGTELLTARYTLRDDGALRTYAGAGLNQAQYFHDADGEPGPTFFTRRNRSRSLGVAAEIGAELRMSERVRVSADVRWADLDERAEALRSDYGPVGADPVLFGVGVGYRFR